MATIDGQPEQPPELSQQASLFDVEALERQDYRDLCLKRLGDLVALRSRVTAEQGEEADLHRRLVDHALYSIYRDCLGAGASTEARQLIEQGGALNVSFTEA